MHIFYSLLIFALIGTFCAADEHSNDLEVERVKRVAVEDVEFASADERPARLRQSSSRSRASKDDDAPATTVKNSAAIILPPYHDSSLATFDKSTQCLLYLEGITIVVIKKKSIGDVQHAFALPMNFANDSYGYQKDYVNCPNSTAADKPFATGTPFSFTIDYQVGTAGQELKNSDQQVVMSIKKGFKLLLNFVSNTGFDLVSANVSGLSITGADFLSKGANIKNSGATNAKAINMRAYYGYNYACSGTPALLFTPDDNTDVLVGIVLNNFQVQGYGINNDGDKTLPYFGSKTTDCIPTFNQGTWMGIIVTLILVSVLAFAFLMLNSVQTMDRFDDPKQKQIVINFKE
jgi:hypothetical protein